ncbi:lipase [Paraburkholderia sp. WC7.3g]|uniref:Alpha/beta fold hydrolase n=1 Tax=Paraburkholderia podalyriae TaxID=1938811 RepID=A0ABR7Q1Y7_9BURK|nr:alpha/beta hydrolase [Paraburkholderia podalyriae]MBC8752564.1 alpha/beta fold hydrolase [Paraburkholderia podalyriae]
MSNPLPVVFIHGFIGTLDVASYESQHATPDLVGYGRCQSVSLDAISLPGQVEHLRAFVDARFGSKPVDVVGHSVGGAIAMLFAHTYPAYVRRIVNVEGNFTLDDAFWSASVGRMSPSEADAMMNRFRSDPFAWISDSVTVPAPHLREVAIRWLAHQPASTLRAMGQSVVATTGDEDYLVILEQVFDRRPVYLLSGEHSRKGWNVPDWALEKSAGDHTLANSGHLMMLDDEVAFVAAIKRFLAE